MSDGLDKEGRLEEGRLEAGRVEREAPPLDPPFPYRPLAFDPFFYAVTRDAEVEI